ncbi:hypothetical protein NE237_031073 [Protea cynaroides]|uniref:Uncharacterized protein n=1 Tax=Protea cynaroides TaxID=273540 RepID=A0A9Q0L1D3_9MAGN|nr:hypothetical protein NE237_031073 [Protea cynaroides]
MPGEGPTAGKPVTLGSQMLDKGTQMLQSLKPVKQMQQHVCSFRLYSHDMNRQIETHHYVIRLNQDFLTIPTIPTLASSVISFSFLIHRNICQVKLINGLHYSDHGTGVEYIVSDKIFTNLSPDEQKPWHSHAYEIKSGIWLNPRVSEMLQKTELRNLAKTYGKCWCTWRVERASEAVGAFGKGGSSWIRRWNPSGFLTAGVGIDGLSFEIVDVGGGVSVLGFGSDDRLLIKGGSRTFKSS